MTKLSSSGNWENNLIDLQLVLFAVIMEAKKRIILFLSINFIFLFFYLIARVFAKKNDMNFVLLISGALEILETMYLFVAVLWRGG